MEEMHSSTPFFSHGGSKSTSATSRVPRQRRRDPMRWLSLRARGEARRLDGASTRQRDTLTSRSHAATIFLARIRGRSHRSNRMSNATVRILSDDPGSVEGLAATLRSRLAIGYPCGLTTATETSRLCPPRGRHWSVSMPRPAICTRSGGVSTTSPKTLPFHQLFIDALSLKAASARSGRPGAGQRSRRCTAFATRRCRTETRCLAPLSDRAARRRISRP
jgi:hypothetical protein